MVIGWSKINHEGSYSGNYIGPVTVEKVDNAGTWRSFQVFVKTGGNEEEQTSNSKLPKHVKRRHSSRKFFRKQTRRNSYRYQRERVRQHSRAVASGVARGVAIKDSRSY